MSVRKYKHGAGDTPEWKCFVKGCRQYGQASPVEIIDGKSAAYRHYMAEHHGKPNRGTSLEEWNAINGW